MSSKNILVNRLRDIRRSAKPPLNNRNWYCLMPDINIFPDYADGSPQAREIAQGVLLSGLQCSARIKSISIPTPAVETDKEINVNSYWYHATHNDISEIQLEVFELGDGATLDYFTRWQAIIMNADGTNNPPAFYKRDLKYVHMDSAHNQIFESTLTGFFVSNIDQIQADYESSEFLMYSITLTGDAISHRILGAGEREIVKFIEVQKSIKEQIFDSITDKVDEILPF